MSRRICLHSLLYCFLLLQVFNANAQKKADSQSPVDKVFDLLFEKYHDDTTNAILKAFRSDTNFKAHSYGSNASVFIEEFKFRSIPEDEKADSIVISFSTVRWPSVLATPGLSADITYYFGDEGSALKKFKQLDKALTKRTVKKFRPHEKNKVIYLKDEIYYKKDRKTFPPWNIILNYDGVREVTKAWIIEVSFPAKDIRTK